MEDFNNIVTEEARKKVWHNLLLADINSRYFGHLSSSYYNLDLYSKIFLAVMASGTVAGWAIWKDGNTYPYGVLAWKGFSSISAVVSVIMPIINVGKKLEAASRLKGEWNDILIEYDVLWLSVEEMPQTKVVKEIARLGHLESKLSIMEAVLPLHKTRLIRQCQREAIKARNVE